MTLTFPQQKEIANTHTAIEISNQLRFSFAIGTKSRSPATKRPYERESKTHKIQEESLLRSLPTGKSPFSLLSIILSLPGCLREMLSAYKKGLRDLSLKAALGTESTWQTVCQCKLVWFQRLWRLPSNDTSEESGLESISLAYHFRLCHRQVSFQALPPGQGQLSIFAMEGQFPGGKQ